ncbi:phage tail tape measure protein [Pleomorphovibrio marinus]|uniref:hypothetical protein n=1 Tax=Pleomorphovibrio marinus TaxID=2164132 RepID=UPI000E0B61A1|nr:hypothetical protein [Pleomorphovibrio marinus]
MNKATKKVTTKHDSNDIKQPQKICEFPNSSQLDDCQQLQAMRNCDVVHFKQFMLVKSESTSSKDNGGEESEGKGKVKPQHTYIVPVKRMQNEVERRKQRIESRHLQHLFKTAEMFKNKGRLDASVAILYSRARLAQQMEGLKRNVKSEEDSSKVTSDRSSKQFAAQPAFHILQPANCTSKLTPIPPHNTTGPRNPYELFKDLVVGMGIVPSPPKTEPPLEPLLALGVRYRQEWCSEGYRRGRLVRSIPLTPNETVEIITKMWDRRTERRQRVESVQEDISTEFVGDEKWSLSTTKQVSATLTGSANLNSSLSKGVEVSLPIEVINLGAKLGEKMGGDIGAKGTFESSIKQTEEQIRQATLTSAHHLKNSVTSTVEMAHEVGREVTHTQSISNTNRCHSLTYHYFEVVEDFSVFTRAEEVAPYLLIPLGYPNITKEWLLCHECLLRRFLPCETYYNGFDAAKQLLANEKLGLFQGALSDPVVNNSAAAMETLVQMVLGIYRKLAEANIFFSGDFSGSPLDDAMSCVTNPRECANITWEWLANFLSLDSDQPSSGGTGPSLIPDNVANCIDEMLEMAENAPIPTHFLDGDALEAWKDVAQKAFSCGGEAVSALCSIAPEVVRAFMCTGGGTQVQPQMSASTALLASPGGFEAGPGSYLYWQILRTVSPELELALATLAARYEQVRMLPEGAQRNRALVEAVATFINQAGDMQAAFSKIDMITTAMGVGGISAVTALASVGGPGAMISTAISATITTLLAVFGDDNGMLDLIPDDEGLKNHMMSLYGHYLSMAQFAGEVAMLGANATIEERAQYERMLQERRQEQRKYAQLRVEYERLVCHIRKNLAYYAQVVWTQMGTADIQRLLEKFDLPLYAVEHRWSGFVGNRAAVLITDPESVLGDDFDWSAAKEQLVVEEILKDTREPLCLTMPTAGMTVEPALGLCNGCEDFVRTHRELDLNVRRAEVHKAKAEAEQAVLEAERFKKRLAKDLLGDPTPYEGANSVTVQVQAKPENE